MGSCEGPGAGIGAAVAKGEMRLILSSLLKKRSFFPGTYSSLHTG